MSTPTQIRTALASAINAISGISCTAKVPANPRPPCAIILPASPFIEYEQNFTDADSWLNFTVRILTGTESQQGAQTLLDSFLAPSGASSVRAALAADPTLGGVAIGLRVPQVNNYGAFVYGEALFLGAELSVRVYATQ